VLLQSSAKLHHYPNEKLFDSATAPADNFFRTLEIFLDARWALIGAHIAGDLFKATDSFELKST
jgi:hypothetical protein